MNEKQETTILLKEIKEGSREAFDQFYEQHISFVYHIALSILKNRLEAEDLCHDIFVEVFQKPHEYRPEKGSIKAWLAVKTRSRCLDYAKKKKPILKERWEEIVHSIPEEKALPEVKVMSKAEREAVLEALEKIPDDQRAVLYGAYYEGRTQRELAKDLKRPLGSIKSLVRYGLNNLRKQKTLLSWAKPSGGEKKNE